MHKDMPLLQVLAPIPEKSEANLYLYDFKINFSLPIFPARTAKPLKYAGSERFHANDPQTYPQKMCTTENRLTAE
jgi:hypothetical protein